MAKSGNGKRKASGLRAFGLKVFNKLFLRSTISRTGKDVAGLSAQMRLVDKRVEYMIARMDAYAEAEDKIDAALREEIRRRDDAITTSIRELSRQCADTGRAMNALEQRINTIADAQANVLAGLQDLLAPRDAEGNPALDLLQEQLAALSERKEANFADLRERLADQAEAQARTISGLEDRLSAITSIQENVVLSLQKLLSPDAAEAQFAAFRKVLEEQAVEIRKNRSQLVSAMERNATLVHDAVRQATLNEFRQREATQALVREMNFGLDADLGEGEPVAPDYLLHLYRHIVRRRPAEVVAFGCGLSTLVAAAALAANGSGRLVAIDEDEARVAAVNAALTARGLLPHAEALHAPLGDWTPPQPTRLGTSWQWYTLPAAMEALEAIGLVIVEGPRIPNAIYVRYPAIPQLRARMIPGSAALMPDAKRPYERAVATEWARLSDMRADFVDDAIASGLAEVVVRVERPDPA